MNSTDALQKAVTRNDREELSVMCFRAFFRGVFVGSVKGLLFSRSIHDCNAQGALMKVSNASIVGRFDFDILQLLERMDDDPILKFASPVFSCEVFCDAFCSLDRFQHAHMA